MRRPRTACADQTKNSLQACSQEVTSLPVRLNQKNFKKIEIKKYCKKYLNQDYFIAHSANCDEIILIEYLTISLDTLDKQNSVLLQGWTNKQSTVTWKLCKTEMTFPPSQWHRRILSIYLFIYFIFFFFNFFFNFNFVFNKNCITN